MLGELQHRKPQSLPHSDTLPSLRPHLLITVLIQTHESMGPKPIQATTLILLSGARC